jgi:hypothetical protein
MAVSWNWRIEEGELWLLDAAPHREAVGYSGTGSDKNNPASVAKVKLGPIPCGNYTILAPRDDARLGPYVLDLVPAVTNEMFGRSLFRIHGDSIDSPGNASEGCIILPRNARVCIWTSGYHVLIVTVR